MSETTTGTPLTAERAAEIQARLDAAGPLDRCTNSHGTPSLCRPGDRVMVEAVAGATPIGLLWWHAPEDIPALLADRSAKDAEIARLRERVMRPCFTCGHEQSIDGTAATCARCLSARVESLERDRIKLAKLAAPAPQFYGPFGAWEAEKIRDEVLAALTPDPHSHAE